MPDKDIKEKVSVAVKVGIVSVDDPESILDALHQQILKVAGALKARGVTSASLSLKFDAKFEQ